MIFQNLSNFFMHLFYIPINMLYTYEHHLTYKIKYSENRMSNANK